MLGMSPRNLQDRDSRGERQPGSRRKWTLGVKDKVREMGVGGSLQEATWENELPLEPGSDGGAGRGERAGVPGSQLAP